MMPLRFAILAAALLTRPLAAQVPVPPTREALAARVDSLIPAYIARYGLASASVAIVRGNETLVVKAWGLADVAAKRAATDATTYRIGSISKQFTAALLLKLVDRGKLALSDSIGRYLAGLRPEWRPLTIERLLNHTSGMQNDFRVKSRYEENLPSDSLIVIAARDTMAFTPGTRYAYSNTGYMLLGVLVEKLYGKSYGAALRDEIARPLGLKRLGWCDQPDVTATEAKGYDRSSAGELSPIVYLHISQSLGSGGICASASDLATWNQALHGGRVLSAASYTAMTTPRGAATDPHYGFGISVDRTGWGTPVLLHGGGTPGFVAANAWFAPESLSVTVLVNNNTLPPGAANILPLLARTALGRPIPTF